MRNSTKHNTSCKNKNATQLYILCTFLLILITACESAPAPTQKSNGSALPANSQLTRYVNPFIGTAPAPSAHYGFGGNAGDTIPDATYPLGMVQWGPDTPSGIPGNYYYPDSTIKGFSLTHFSGRGCPVYGDFPFMPYIGSQPSSSTFSHQREVAQPGYYKVHLDSANVDVELTATKHGGMAHFTYPTTSSAALLINASGSTNGSSDASVSIDTARHEIVGRTTSTVGCGTSHYTLYFSARFDRPFTRAEGNGTATARLFFDTTQQRDVHVRVGISFVSVANAQLNRDKEIASTDFATIRQAANDAWNSYLRRIEIQGGTPDERTSFYTALYHCFFHPNIFNDVNGEYLGFDGKVHALGPEQHAQYENIPTWDQYRSLTRLWSIIAPDEASDLAQSLVNDAQQGDGHLPRWEQANADSHGMNGDGADVEIADIYAYGNTHFNSAAALSVMINGQSYLREGFKDYTSLGYVADSTTNNSVVITQEYTNDDFALAQFARALGKNDNYHTYLKRSDNWRNVLNTSTGYVQPRNRDGSWRSNFSLTSEHGFQENTSAQSTWMESFNLRGLFDALGGNDAVVKRLDTFFTRLNDGPNGAHAYMGNEPSLEVPWEYDFAGAPAHTQQVVRRIQSELFANAPSGLPGNDDAGATSSWYVFSALGLYPEIPGVAGFVVGSPLFPSATVHLAGGHSLHISASKASLTTPYVQSLQLNGTPATNLWLPWNALQHGATLTFSLTDRATSWGSAAMDAPPSFPADSGA